MIQGKGKNLSFEIKTKASVTGVTPATQLPEVKREHQDTKGCSVGSGLGINSQPRRKRSQNSFQSQLRGCSTPLDWAAAGEQHPELPKPRPGPALPQPHSCCQQSLTATPGTFPEAFSGWFQGSCSGITNLGLQQPWVWGVSFIPHFWAVFLGVAAARADPTGMLLLILICSLQELQDRQPWLPVTLAQFFWSVPLDKGDTEKGEKLQQWLRE